MSSNERIGAELAESFRVTHELGTGPLGDLFTLSEETVGVDVMSMDAGESEHGLTAWDPATGRAVIAVATTPHPMRQRSSIAHELGHVLQGIDAPTAFPGERSPQEIQADSFARHLLLPRAELRNIGRSPSLAQFSEIVRTFGLSPQMAATENGPCSSGGGVRTLRTMVNPSAGHRIRLVQRIPVPGRPIPHSANTQTAHGTCDAGLSPGTSQRRGGGALVRHHPGGLALTTRWWRPSLGTR